jgi:hypothetical protein
MASAHIAMLVNVTITSYCHGWQWTTMVATKANYCNARLAMVASSYCNKIFCNHGQRTRLGGKNYILQPNRAYCNIFLSLRKGQKFVVLTCTDHCQIELAACEYGQKTCELPLAAASVQAVLPSMAASAR